MDMNNMFDFPLMVGFGFILSGFWFITAGVAYAGELDGWTSGILTGTYQLSLVLSVIMTMLGMLYIIAGAVQFGLTAAKEYSR